MRSNRRSSKCILHIVFNIPSKHLDDRKLKALSILHIVFNIPSKQILERVALSGKYSTYCI